MKGNIMTLYTQNEIYLDALDNLLREIDELQARPLIRCRFRASKAPARSTVSAWIDQFVALLAVRP